MKIFVSGLYCGSNPQPGLGIIRSLKAGFPKINIIGVEYSNRVSGIHWPEIDEIWLERPWDEIDLTMHGERIKLELDSGSYWISGSDLETMWLSEIFPDGHPNLLAPDKTAFQQISKPCVAAANQLPVAIPEHISTGRSDWELHRFCREHDWNVWLKGPYYDASRTPSWEAVEIVRNALSKVWSTERLFLQKHVSGYEESVMLCAYQGELLGAVRMQKRDITPEGKTWAGEVSQISAEFLQPLREMIRSLNWTGGGELEMVRDADDKAWLLEMNPRFPAWVFGATIAGFNLPALLVEAASGVRILTQPSKSSEFTRVVLEIPVQEEFPLPTLPEPFSGAVGHSMKHPSGLTSLAKKLHEIDPSIADAEIASRPVTDLCKLPESYGEDISSFDVRELETPQFMFMESTARHLFDSAGARSERYSRGGIKVSSAYSIKTNPDHRLLHLALKNGLLAEAISLLEVHAALDAGFRADQIILNGPGKWWPDGMLPAQKLHAVFCDSLADLDRVLDAINLGKLSATYVGVRIRPPNVVSRFGIPVDSPKALSRLTNAIRRLPQENAFAIHFHMASANIGIEMWKHLLESVIQWCACIEQLSGRKIELLDMGGGWFPEDMHSADHGRFDGALNRITAALPNVREIMSEPGKAMAQPSMALAMRILEIQHHDDDYIEAVVDASIAELPMYFFYPHRMVRQCPQTGKLSQLGRGKTHLMGRLCMEHDIIAANVSLPEGTKAGDLLFFCDAGGYDRSMSYVFGRG